MAIDDDNRRRTGTPAPLSGFEPDADGGGGLTSSAPEPDAGDCAPRTDRAAGPELPAAPPPAQSDARPEIVGRSYDSLVTYAEPPAETTAEAPDKAAALADAADSDEEIQRKLDQIPPEPGVYLLRDKAGKVLYVGKAKSLRSRVRAYFRDGGDTRFQVRFLMSRVKDFETLVTSNEKEALILENNLIKQYRPRYNIRLKDDKSYLSAKVTKHAWPRIMVTRKIVKDGGRYFGPFGSADGLRETLDIIRKVFPLRTCSDAVFRNRSRPCLEYQIKRCLGPCCLPVDRAEYQRHLDAAIMLLEGRDLELLKAMREQMKNHAERLEFEEAAKLRDRVRAIEKTVEKQTVLHHWGIDQDVFGLYREGGFIEAIVLMVRRGKLTSTQSWSFEDLEFSDEDILADLLTQFYSGGRYLPDEVLLPVELEDAEVRAELLSERRGKKVTLAVPQRGEKTRLLQMANENARQSFAARRDSEKTRERMLDELRVKLRLRNTPKRIECYDISNLQGSMVVASQVVFDEGLARKDLYRRYRIRTVDGQDDFASMSEVLSRRLARAVKEQDYPDLIIVDGGKGQLNMALQVLRELGLADQIDTIGLAKQHVLNGPRQRQVVKSEERVFIPNRKDPIVLKQNSNALVPAGARFATRPIALRSPTTANCACAPACARSWPTSRASDRCRARALLRHFGSLKRIRAASAEEIAQVKGINRDLAAAVRRDLDEMTAVLDSEEREEESARTEAQAAALISAPEEDGQAVESAEDSGEAVPTQQDAAEPSET